MPRKTHSFEYVHTLQKIITSYTTQPTHTRRTVFCNNSCLPFLLLHSLICYSRHLELLLFLSLVATHAVAICCCSSLLLLLLSSVATLVFCCWSRHLLRTSDDYIGVRGFPARGYFILVRDVTGARRLEQNYMSSSRNLTRAREIIWESFLDSAIACSPFGSGAKCGAVQHARRCGVLLQIFWCVVQSSRRRHIRHISSKQHASTLL